MKNEINENFGLDVELIVKLNEIFTKFLEIEKVIIYGSRAKGNYKEGSDIDITIYGNINEETLSTIKNDIEELNSPYLYDISIFNKIKNQDLIEHIQRVGKILYNNIV